MKIITVFLTIIGCACLTNADESLDKDCGIIATYVACTTFNGFQTNYTDFLLSAGPPGSEKGYNLAQLEALVSTSGLFSKCIETDMESLRWYMDAQPLLAVALLDDSHFVLVKGFRNGAVEYFDPPVNVVRTESEFKERWTNKVLLVSNQKIPVYRYSWIMWVTVATICTAILIPAVTMINRRISLSQRK